MPRFITNRGVFSFAVKNSDFSTLSFGVLKVYSFVTHFTLKGLIIQTVSKRTLISKNANQARQVPTLPYDLHKSAYNIIVTMEVLLCLDLQDEIRI